MSAQRKSVYSIRQQLLAGRYETDELDEDGRATGNQKKFKAKKDIKETVKPMVTELLGMFCDPPVMARGTQLAQTRRLLTNFLNLYLNNDQTAWRETWGPELLADSEVGTQANAGISLGPVERSGSGEP